MQKRRILINAFMSTFQILLVSGVLFFLYRFLLKTIGVEMVGVWSLVLATTSVTQIANLGLSGSVVKFVAKYIAHNDYEKVSKVIQTSVLSIAVIIGLLIIIFYPVIKWILVIVVPEKSIKEAVSILPYALISLWISMITSIFQSGIDGAQKIYLRNIIVMCGSLIFAILCYIFAQKKGLIGLAYAQVINNIVLLLFSWAILKYIIKSLPIIPYKWNKNTFKEIISYGINFQIISITGMLYDPITKSLLIKFGGLEMLGYYEMANRMVQQFRALIVSANQVLVPSIADLQEREPEKIKSIYITNYNLLFYLSLPMYVLIITSSPIISRIWIGNYENIFINFVIFLSIGNFLNTIAGPSYFSNLGIGILKWNVIGHITIGILNVVLCTFLGMIFKGYGVVLGWIIALSVGSGLIYIIYHINNKIPLSYLLPKESRGLMLFYLVILMLISFFWKTNDKSSVIIFIISTILLIIPLYFHPMKKKIFFWLNEMKHNS